MGEAEGQAGGEEVHAGHEHTDLGADDQPEPCDHVLQVLEVDK